MTRALPKQIGAAALAGFLLALPAVPFLSAQEAARAGLAQSDAKKARRAFQQALEAETAANWVRAFELHSEAVSAAPENGQYLMRREAARFQMVQQHVDRAERAAVMGQTTLARQELEAARKLDPAYVVVQERLAQLQASSRTSTVTEPLAAVPRLRPQPGTHRFDYRGDTRGAYEEIARKFGLIASFDPDLRAAQIRFRVSEVDCATAMRVLATQTDTFWRVVDEKTFFVAADTPQKRREYEPVVVHTVSLAGTTSPEQMTEIVRLVREIAGITNTQVDTRARTVTLRDSAESVALAVQLIQDLEQAVGEMMLEVEILEVDRDAMRRLGVSPPSTARIFTVSPQDIREAQQSPEALLRVLQRIFGSSGALSGLTGIGASGFGTLIPPLVAFGGGRSILLATLPGAAAEFADAFSLLRRGRRMLLRAQDGQPATFFVGERFPIALAVLQPNLAGASLGDVGPGSLQRRDYETGTSPTAITLADFNADNLLDLAVANSGDDSVSVFLAQRDGTFGARADFPAGTAPSAIVSGDFNNDARLDLAVTNETANTVSVLIGAGDGTFGAPSTFPTGTTPRAIVAANLDNDNLLDLAVANGGSNTVSILRGNGTGAFPTRTDIAVGGNPSALTVGSFNGDAAFDLVVANQDADTVSILLGNGVGGFSSPTDFPVGDAPAGVVTADFNNDGSNDVATANEEGNTVSILLGNGNGTFGANTEFTVGNGPVALAASDFTADGRTDLVVTNSDASTISILLGTGDGGFGARADFTVGDTPVAVAVADLNGDGRRDAVVASRAANLVSTILNQVSISAPGAGFVPSAVQPYPGFQYEDLGLKVRATPRLHPANEVTLQLEIEIRSRSGDVFNTIPVISNRTLQQTVRLRENERTLLTGIIQREEMRGISGWPGMGNTPGLGRVASRRETDRGETELLISITPRRIRLADRADRMLYVGREHGARRGTGPGREP